MAHVQRGRTLLSRLAKSHSSYEGITNPLLFSGQGLRYKKTMMKVILTTPVDRLGRAGDMVAVAPGYFRNYLMPNLLAVPNLDKYTALVKEQLKLQESEQIKEIKPDDETSKEEKMREYSRAAKILADSRLSLRKFIKTEKELRSPVTKEELVEEVARQFSVAIQPENLHLPVPLISLGEHEVPLRLPRQIPLPEGVHAWVLRVKIRKI